MKHTHTLLTALAMMAIAVACTSAPVATSAGAEFVPAAPDYADAAMWHIELNDNGNGADLFYIPSTWEYDWTTADSVTSHYADITNPQHLADMNIEMTAAAAYMADGNNFYSPYYRHITLDSWATLNEDTIARRYNAVPFVDVKNAFNYFISNYNNRRPFILAGFSQGAKSVVELMKIMPDTLRSRMIAAYVLGYKVTPDDLKAAPWITAATDSIDTGVTICYNSVSDVKYVKPVVSTPNTMCINPVNWRTDSTPATLNDTITVTLNTEYNVLVLEGFDGSYLPNILNILNVGDYHGVEPWLYSEQLRQNIHARTAAYRRQHP
jgi:hypothetical protein